MSSMKCYLGSVESRSSEVPALPGDITYSIVWIDDSGTLQRVTEARMPASGVPLRAETLLVRPLPVNSKVKVWYVPTQSGHDTIFEAFRGEMPAFRPCGQQTGG